MKKSEPILSSRKDSDERMRLYRIGEQLRRRLAAFFKTPMLPPCDGYEVTNRRGHTEQFNRLHVAWLALNEAMARVRRDVHERCETPLTPWNCANAEVRCLWEQITRPENLPASWEWLYQSASGEPEIWAQQALQECQLRAENSKP